MIALMSYYLSAPAASIIKANMAALNTSIVCRSVAGQAVTAFQCTFLSGLIAIRCDTDHC